MGVCVCVCVCVKCFNWIFSHCTGAGAAEMGLSAHACLDRWLLKQRTVGSRTHAVENFWCDHRTTTHGTPTRARLAKGCGTHARPEGVTVYFLPSFGAV